MAKNSFPMMQSGGGVLSKVVGALVTLAVLALVVKRPNEAADWVTGAMSMLGVAIEGIATFLSQVLG